MKKLIYPACFYPCEDKPGAYTVVVPDLPGCVSEGETLEDAIEMGADAASGWVLDELEDGRTAPKPSAIQDVHPDDPSGFVNLLVLDIMAYSEKYGNKTVRKNLTLPAWLNTFGEMNGVNFSQALLEGMMMIYRKKQEA